MKRFFGIFILSVCVFSCNSNANQTETQDDDTSQAGITKKYLFEAKQSSEYKDTWIDIQKIKIGLNTLTKQSTLSDSDAIVNEYNSDIGQHWQNVDNITEVKMQMKNIDSTYLKSVQLKIAQQLLLSHLADINSEKK